MAVTSTLPGIPGLIAGGRRQGVHARYLQHQTAGGLEQESQAVPALVARAHDVPDADD